ncbi:Transformer-2 protein-like beta, partial [Fragariocoptes setiger]
MADKDDDLNDDNPRRSGIRSHHTRSRSPHGGDSGRSRRYDDYNYYRSPSTYRERETTRYDDYAPHPSSSRARSRSRSPMSSRRRHEGDRENPPVGRCLGVFGLSIYTKEADLHDLFSRYGPIDDIQIVYDAQSGRSRGFAFVYYTNTEDAIVAKERTNNIEILGRRLRIDFSLTQRAHTPTPGVYMGKSHGGGRSTYSQSRGSSFNNGGSYRQSSYSHSHSRSRYPPPHPSTLPPQDYGRRRLSRSRSISPRKYYY